ncbi:MAG: hypothetical protein ACMUIL_08660 [bacterium]
MYILFGLAVIGMVCWFPSGAWCGEPPPSKKTITWGRTFGGKHIDVAHAVQQTSDGGYILAGETFSFGSGKSDVYLLKLNAAGSKVWGKYYGGEDTDSAESVCQTSDGGYIVAGGTQSAGAGKCDVYVLKLDAKGDKVWEKTLGGKEWDTAHSVAQASDGGYIVAGDSQSFGSGKGDAYVLKLDPNGKTVWDRTFNGNGAARAHDVKQTSDGGYILAGTTYSFGSGSGEAYIVKVDGSGNKVWEKMFGGKGRGSARSVKQTSDGGYIIGGQVSTSEIGQGDALVIRLDGQGKVVWEKTFGIKDLDPASFVSAKDTKGANAFSVIQTSGGAFILAISTYTKLSIADPYLLKLDGDGNKVWATTFGVRDLDDEYASLFTRAACVYPHALLQSCDGGYMVAGGIVDRREGISDIYVIKTNEEGRVK